MVCMTLNCVGIKQFSAIRIVHRNLSVKRFFHLPKLLLLSLVFAYIYISHGSVETLLPCGGTYNKTLFQIACRVCQWKNCENWSIIGEDMDKSNVARFLEIFEHATGVRDVPSIDEKTDCENTETDGDGDTQPDQRHCNWKR